MPNFSNQLLDVKNKSNVEIIKTNSLGVIPSPSTTMFIQYRVGGGSSSNIGPNVVNQPQLVYFIPTGIGSDQNDDIFLRFESDRGVYFYILE